MDKKEEIGLSSESAKIEPIKVDLFGLQIETISKKMREVIDEDCKNYGNGQKLEHKDIFYALIRCPKDKIWNIMIPIEGNAAELIKKTTEKDFNFIYAEHFHFSIITTNKFNILIIHPDDTFCKYSVAVRDKYGDFKFTKSVAEKIIDQIVNIGSLLDACFE